MKILWLIFYLFWAVKSVKNVQIVYPKLDFCPEGSESVNLETWNYTLDRIREECENYKYAEIKGMFQYYFCPKIQMRL